MLCRCLLADPLWNPQPSTDRSQDQEYVYHIWCTYRLIFDRDINPCLESLGDDDVEEANLSLRVIKQLGNLYFTSVKAAPALLGLHLTEEDNEAGREFLDAMYKDRALLW